MAFLWPMLLVMMPLQVQGQSIQSLESIREAAKYFLLQQNTHLQGKRVITVGDIDSRLRLLPCDQDLHVTAPPGSRLLGNTTVGVSCRSSKPWKLYVPVNIKIFNQVLTTNNYLPRGTVIKADDLTFTDKDLSVLGRGYFTEYDNVVGKVVKQDIMTGSIINPNHISNPKIIRRGEGVTILASADGFEIRMKGKALMDGTAGDLIKVKNLKSKRIVEGKVLSSGVVKILF